MAFTGDSIFWVEVEKVVPNPFQPRREFDEAKLKELAESIRMYGVLQPLTVTKKEIQREDGAFYSEYELIAGERRLRASKLAGLSQVPVIIRSGEQTEQEKLELAIIENLQREDLNCVDRAFAFKQLSENFKMSHAQIAAKMGRSREYVSNTLRLLALPKHMLSSLQQGEMTEGHARSLLMLNERPEEQDVLFREILMKKIAVREAERIARKIATDKIRKKKWKDSDPHLIEVEKQFTESLGTRVQIQKTDYGGRLTIDYFGEEDLDKLLEMARKSREAGGGKSAAAIVNEELTREAEENDKILESLTENTPLEGELSVGELPAINQAETSVAKSVEPELAPEVTPSETEVSSTVVPESPVVQREVASEAPIEMESVSSEIQDNTNPTPSATPSESVEKPVGVSDKKEDESDLYSIKNFGI